jgi:hypothetical protein
MHLNLLKIHFDKKKVPSAQLYLLKLKDDDSGPGSSVGIATGCGLDGPGIESR